MALETAAGQPKFAFVSSGSARRREPSVSSHSTRSRSRRPVGARVLMVPGIGMAKASDRVHSAGLRSQWGLRSCQALVYGAQQADVKVVALPAENVAKVQRPPVKVDVQ